MIAIIRQPVGFGCGLGQMLKQNLFPNHSTDLDTITRVIRIEKINDPEEEGEKDMNTYENDIDIDQLEQELPEELPEDEDIDDDLDTIPDEDFEDLDLEDIDLDDEEDLDEEDLDEEEDEEDFEEDEEDFEGLDDEE